MNGSRGGYTINRLRLVVFGAAVAVVLLVYVGQLFSMQIVDGYIYTLRAEQVKRRSALIAAPRGNIYDRNADTPLATSRESFAVDINPADVPNEEMEELFERLALALDTPVSGLRDRIPPRRYNEFQAIEVRRGLSFRTIAALAERKVDFPGVSWRIEPARHYVYGDSFAHVLGYVGDITPEELQILYNRGYTAVSVIGKAGVELEYDERLRGADGMEIRTVDARGRRVESDQNQEIWPEQGHDLVLTLDRSVQLLAQNALGERIGSIVVLKPATGEILAMVSYPSYDPNRFYEDGGRDYFAEVSLDPRGSFINRAIHAQESPASTWKVVMTTAIIAEHAFPIDGTVFCPGTYTVGNRVFRCHKQFGHGDIALYDALAESCNVYYYTMGNEYLGHETIIEYARMFGFGERTGIDLRGERPGLLPTPEWKERVFNDAWRPGDTVNMSIGQGFLQVTPLQLANMVAMIVNDGVIYRPHLVREVRDPLTGRVISRNEPEVLRTSSLGHDTFAMVRDAMRTVVTSGTPQIVMTSNAPIAGKTGTAQTPSEEERHAWFIGFSPYGSSRPSDYVVTVVWVDAANEWDWWAPYATNIVMHGIHNSLDYERTVADLRTRRDPWLWYGRGLPE